MSGTMVNYFKRRSIYDPLDKTLVETFWDDNLDERQCRILDIHRIFNTGSVFYDRFILVCETLQRER